MLALILTLTLALLFCGSHKRLKSRDSGWDRAGMPLLLPKRERGRPWRLYGGRSGFWLWCLLELVFLLVLAGAGVLAVLLRFLLARAFRAFREL